MVTHWSILQGLCEREPTLSSCQTHLTVVAAGRFGERATICLRRYSLKGYDRSSLMADVLQLR